MANGVGGATLLRSISGNYAAINTSGQVAVDATVTATANISGQYVVLGSGSAVGLSGVSVVASVTANISGQAVFLGSGSVFGLSGVQTREVGTTIINPKSGAYIITGLSGGAVLFSGGPLISATLRSASGNNLMYIAGLGASVPSDGQGIPLYANETLTLKVTNFNAISAFAATSGQLLSYIGLQ